MSSCGGAGPPPDPDELAFDYWQKKADDIHKQLQYVENDLVVPQFTVEEERTLAAMEAEESHFFATFAWLERENPRVKKTVKELAVESETKWARGSVWALLSRLWSAGLAGQWILHHEPIYITEHDTRMRVREDIEHDDGYGHRFRGEPNPRRKIILEGADGMRYDGDVPLADGQPRLHGPVPDFDSVDYWMALQAHLEQMLDDICAGKVQHAFTEGELFQIQLIEQQLIDNHERLCADSNTNGNPAPGPIDAWLDDAWLDGLLPHNEHVDTLRSLSWSLSRQEPRPTTPLSQSQANPAMTNGKRKRSIMGGDGNDELAEGDEGDEGDKNTGPAKRSKRQLRPQRYTVVPQPAARRNSTTKTGAKLNDQTTKRATKSPTEPIAQHATNPAAKPAKTVRRSARIAARPPKIYR